jgi:hypothetical protein
MPFDPNQYPETPRAAGAGSSRLLPVGKHRVTVTEHAFDGGTLVITFAGEDGRSIRSWYQMEGKAAFRLANLLRAVGWAGVMDDSDGGVRAALYGVALEIVVADETYLGATKTKVKYTNRLPDCPARSDPSEPSSPSLAPLEDEDIPF